MAGLTVMFASRGEKQRGEGGSNMKLSCFSSQVGINT